MVENNPIYGESGIIRDRSQDYEKAAEGKSLEVPPHLRARKTQGALEIPQIAQTAVESGKEYRVPRPEFFYTETASDNVSLARDGAEKRIIVDGSIDQVWLKIQDFWRFNGIELSDSNPQTGVMETQWIEKEGNELGFVDSWIKRLTFRDIEGAPKDKLQVSLRPEQADVSRTSITMKHVRFSQNDQVGQIDWNKSAREVGYKSDMMFEMLRYLSKASDKDSAPTLAKLKNPRQGQTSLGRDSRGNPVLKVEAPINQVWDSVSGAMGSDRFDVGTRDKDTGMFYFSYTTSAKVDETERMGFFEWLHSDRGDITFETTALAAALGVGDKDKIRYSSKSINEEDRIRKSQMSQKELDQEAMKNTKGYKIWVGSQVVYVFGWSDDDTAGTYNADTQAYEFTGRYQLKLNRSRSGVYLTVLNDLGMSAPADISQEILWDVKDALAKQ